MNLNDSQLGSQSQSFPIKTQLKNENKNSDDENQSEIIDDDMILQKIAQMCMLSNSADQINKSFKPKFLCSLTKYIRLKKENKATHKSKVENDSNIKKEAKEKASSSKHKKFSEEEDELLKTIVLKLGPKNWRLIASLMPGRTKRQCRDRYVNYLAPGFIRTQWTDEEDELLAEKFIQYGSKWSQIRSFFPNRTSNDIKNRFNYTVSRKLNTINNIPINDSNIMKNAEKEKSSGTDIIEFNQDPFDIFNEKLQVNDFDLIFINE